MRLSHSLRFTAMVALSAAAGLSGCKGKEKREEAVAAATPAMPATPAQGRRIDIKVDNKGYHPASAPAKGGEKLVLAFTRTEESECVQQVIVDGKMTELPLNQAVEIQTTMPADGDLVFTCGMKMFEGRVAAVAK